MQGMLEVLDLPYTGPGVWSSATAMDKPKAKLFYERNNIPTPKSLTLLSKDQYSVQEIIDAVGEHCVIKAATEGSALGVYLCKNAKEIEQALSDVFEIDKEALAETMIVGDEFTVAVLGNEDARALPVIKIVPTHEFYDFESKYAVGGSQHICPAPLSEELTRKAQDLAVAAHNALECRGVSRTDMLLDAEGTFWVLETNTIPGMTNTSLLPEAAKVEGLAYEDLCEQLVLNCGRG
jgi:D-alanine-D-alanine ligase